MVQHNVPRSMKGNDVSSFQEQFPEFAIQPWVENHSTPQSTTKKAAICGLVPFRVSTTLRTHELNKFNNHRDETGVTCDESPNPNPSGVGMLSGVFLKTSCPPSKTSSSNEDSILLRRSGDDSVIPVSIRSGNGLSDVRTTTALSSVVVSTVSASAGAIGSQRKIQRIVDWCSGRAFRVLTQTDSTSFPHVYFV